MPQAIYAQFIDKNGKTELRFYTVTHTSPYAMQSMHDLPEAPKENENKGIDNRVDHSESLLVPFSEVVYVVTKDKKGCPVYYKGRFQEVANKM
jgi:hypothetical protein